MHNRGPDGHETPAGMMPDTQLTFVSIAEFGTPLGRILTIPLTSARP